MTAATEAVAGSRAELHPVGRAGDIPFMEGRSVTVAGRRIAVFRTADGFHAVDAACPHVGGPLSDGIVAVSCVTCPLHNWRIDLTTGDVVSGGEGRVRTYDVVERDGELLVGIEEPAAA